MHRKEFEFVMGINLFFTWILGFVLILIGLILQDLGLKILSIIAGILLMLLVIPGFKKLKKEKFGE